jgi:NhaB family Na+:H+ antiporter
MHAAVGTALGGVATLVGEPQNLLIATKAGW